MEPEPASEPPELTVASSRLHEGRVISLRVDEVRLPNGSTSRREVVEHRGAVAIVALTADGQVLLIRQWRHAVGEWLLEIPAGTLERGEDPAACAARELAEETGYAPGRLEPLVSFYTTPGFTTEMLHVFLARDLRPAPGERDEDEHIEPVAVTWTEALAMCRDGRLRDAKTIAGILTAEMGDRLR